MASSPCSPPNDTSKTSVIPLESKPVLSTSAILSGSSSRNFSSVTSSSFRSERSSTSSSVASCRICRDGGGSSSPLRGVCRCAGSCALVHRECLEKWLSTSNHTSCEVCGFKYQVVVKTKPYSKWFCDGGPFGRDQRGLTGDLVCFVVLTPL